MVAIPLNRRESAGTHGGARFALAAFILNRVIADSRLTVLCPSHNLERTVGRGDAAHYAIRIDAPDILWKIATDPDPGAGELYMDGRWEMAEGDLGAFITMMARNLQALLSGPANVVASQTGDVSVVRRMVKF